MTEVILKRRRNFYAHVGKFPRRKKTMSSKITHTHHLLPKHMGGTDDEWNLVRGTRIIQHAMFHFANWQLWSKVEDFIAWRSLAGKITKEQAIFEAQSLGGKKGGKNRPRWVVDEQAKKLVEWGKQNREFMLEITQETGKKLNEWLKENPEAAKEARRRAAEKNRKPVKITNIKTGESFSFDSVKAAAQFIGCPSPNLTEVLHKKRKTARGFTAEFVI